MEARARSIVDSYLGTAKALVYDEAALQKLVADANRRAGRRQQRPLLEPEEVQRIDLGVESRARELVLSYLAARQLLGGLAEKATGFPCART